MIPPDSRLANERLGILDGWRTVSVALVVLGHIARLVPFATDLNPEIARIPALLAALGVNVFFVISGFVIARGLRSEHVSSGRIVLTAFYLRRLARIVPPLLLYVVTVCGLAFWGWLPESAMGTIRALTFSCNWPSVDCGGWFGGHTWSLSVEEQFYLVFPAILALAGGHLRWLSPLLLGVVMACMTTLAITGQGHLGAFLSNFVPIAFGIVCAGFEDVVRRHFRHGVQILIGLAIALLAMRLSVTVYWPVAPPLCSIGITMALMASLNIKSANVLNAPPMMALGRASYGIYLWQQLATAPLHGVGVVFYSMAIVACVLGAWILFDLMERPINGWASRASRRMTERRSQVGTKSSKVRQ